MADFPNRNFSERDFLKLRGCERDLSAGLRRHLQAKIAPSMNPEQGSENIQKVKSSNEGKMEEVLFQNAKEKKSLRSKKRSASRECGLFFSAGFEKQVREM